MFPFDPLKTSGNLIRSYPLIRMRTCTYQGVGNGKFSDVFMGIKREHLEEKS